MTYDEIHKQLEFEYERVIADTLAQLKKAKPLTKHRLAALLMKANKSYWTARIALLDTDAVNTTDEFARALAAPYALAAESFSDRVRSIYANYKSAFDLTHDDADELMKHVVYDRTIAENLKAVADEMHDGEEKQRILAEISAPAYSFRMDQAEELSRQAKEITDRIAGNEVKADREFLQTEIEKAYNITLDNALGKTPAEAVLDEILPEPIQLRFNEMPKASEPVQDFTPTTDKGVLDSFSLVPESHVREIAGHDWSGEEFSGRIWNNTDELAREVKQVLLEGELTGASEAKMAAKIEERFHVGMYKARRVVRTESNYCINQAELKGMKDAGFDEYEFVTLGENAEGVCDICDDLDGQRFKIKDAVVGVNCPPMHPFCRCKATTPERTEEDIQREIDERIDSWNIPEGMSLDEFIDRVNNGELEQIRAEQAENTTEATQQESYSTLNSVQESAEENSSSDSSNDLAKELTIAENGNQYRKYELDKENPVTITRGKEIQAYKVTNSANSIYISSDAHVKPKQLHQIDMKVSEAHKLLGSVDAENKPDIFIITGDEMAKSAVAAYNPVVNRLFITDSVAVYKKEVMPDFMNAFACGSDDRSSYIHELYHWKDAQEYIRKHGEITKDNLNSYFEWANSKSKKALDKAQENGYNIIEMKQYAKDSYNDGNFSETFIEYRVNKLIGGEKE